MNDGAFRQGKDIKGRGDFGKTHPFSLKPWEGMDKPSESPWNGLKKSKIWNQRTKIKELAEGERPTTKPNQTNKNKKQTNSKTGQEWVREEGGEPSVSFKETEGTWCF